MLATHNFPASTNDRSFRPISRFARLLDAPPASSAIGSQVARWRADPLHSPIGELSTDRQATAAICFGPLDPPPTDWLGRILWTLATLSGLAIAAQLIWALV